MRLPLVLGTASAGLFVGLLVAASACVGDDATPAGGGPGTGTDGGVNPNAVACTTGQGCGNGLCVDGFCCDSPCAGTCQACDVSGKEGTCSPVSGKPHHGACDGDTSGACAGSCDGTAVDACQYPAVACGPAASCAAGVATLPSTCAKGTCPPPTNQTCTLGCFEDGCDGVTQVAAGYSFACAVLTDKKVRCWGANDALQIGQGNGDLTAAYKRPQEVQPAILQNVKMLATTFNSVCALIGDGTVECWGDNSAGELGNGDLSVTKSGVPVQVQGITDATFIGGSSGGHYCAIITGGALKCWGGNTSGQLGNGTVTASPPSGLATPVSVCAPGSTVVPCTPASGATYVAGGDNHTCAAFAGGVVACWGANGDAQLGFAADANLHPFPANVLGAGGTPFTATVLTAGNQITCAVSGGAGYCWGSPTGGRLGNATDEEGEATPVEVCTKSDCSTFLTGATGISAYDESVCGLANGAVKCWGTNSGGELGDGNATASQSFAASTAIASGAVEVYAGGQTNYAVVVDGANRDVRCWGADFDGECGDNGSTTNHHTPVAPLW